MEAELFLMTAEEAGKAPADLVTQSIYRFLFRVGGGGAEEAEKALAGLVTQSLYRFLFRVRWRRSYSS